MAASISTCLQVQNNNFLDADLEHSQKLLPGPSTARRTRHEPSKTAATPNGSLLTRSPELLATLESSRKPATSIHHKTHDTSRREDHLEPSQRTPVTDKMGPGRLKARPRGESDLGKPTPKIKLPTSNGSAFEPVEETASLSGYEYPLSSFA